MTKRRVKEKLGREIVWWLGKSSVARGTRGKIIVADEKTSKERWTVSMGATQGDALAVAGLDCGWLGCGGVRGEYFVPRPLSRNRS